MSPTSYRTAPPRVNVGQALSALSIGMSSLPEALEALAEILLEKLGEAGGDFWLGLETLGRGAFGNDVGDLLAPRAGLLAAIGDDGE